MDKILFSSKSDNWETPIDFFEILDQEFHFTIDVCATEENRKCNKYYSIIDDGLVQEWKGVVWCNPPYGKNIGQWIAKGYNSSLEGATVVMLLPSRTDTKWFHEYCLKGEIRFIKGRLKFGSAIYYAPFPSLICIFRGV